MKTLPEHAAELRRIVAERADVHGDIAEAAAALDAAAEVLRALEWAEGPLDDDGERTRIFCPWCSDGVEPGPLTHKPDCKLAALIGAKVRG